MSQVDPYVRAGVVLIVFGAPFAAYSYWVLSNVTFTALGLASVILGVTAVLVPSSPVPADSVRVMVEAASVNIEALLEEHDATLKAVYMPPVDGRVYCFVPLTGDLGDWQVEQLKATPLRVSNEFGSVRGVSVFPSGSEVVRLSGLGEESGVEDALSFVLVDFLESVEGVKAVRSGDRFVVQLDKIRADTVYPRVRMCLGSSASSVAGCVLAWVMCKPVQFLGEEQLGDSVTASFRLIGVGQE